MPPLPEIAEFETDLIAIRQDLHRHPELGFEEFRTARVVSDLLRRWGVDEIHSIATTGVVGVIEGEGGHGGLVGLRADMDALPIQEKSGVEFTSRTSGVFHGCGHDGHTAILLGAARYLAATRNFPGKVILIFQPAEEGLGGARRMIDEGLFERFPCQEVYGLHNDPTLKPDVVTVKPGKAMAGASFFEIKVTGTGSHAAQPQNSHDPVVASTALVQQLETIVSRNLHPTDVAVLSVTRIQGGSAYNVIPDEVTVGGTIRFFSNDVRDAMCRRINEVSDGIALSFQVSVSVELRQVFEVLENDVELSALCAAAASDVVGETNVSLIDELMTGSEDFADMLKHVRGAYLRLGHTGSIPLHNPNFVLGDEILVTGASVMARIAERSLWRGLKAS